MHYWYLLEKIFYEAIWQLKNLKDQTFQYLKTLRLLLKDETFTIVLKVILYQH